MLYRVFSVRIFGACVSAGRRLTILSKETVVLGPTLIFDKSFLQMLSPDEVSELSRYFIFASTPQLVQEIIADLKKEATSKDRIPEDVVKTLASKMLAVHGLQPAEYRMLAISNLCCTTDVPMCGQVPVDARAPNVAVTKDGRGTVYDATPVQNMWRRWANGDFTTEEEGDAVVWRETLQTLDLVTLSKQWQKFASEHFPAANAASNLPDLLVRVNAMLDDFNPRVQEQLLRLLIGLLESPWPQAKLTMALFKAGLMPRIKDLAPYAASVARLHLTFMIGLGRGFIGPRSSHIVDLEYLFYAPFCSVFVSADKLHRTLLARDIWDQQFVLGPDLKKELQQRVEARAAMTDTKTISRPFPTFPGTHLPDSIIERMWGIYFNATNRVKTRSRKGRPETIEDLEPEIRENFEEAQRLFDAMDHNR